jgi:hypothetical protein
LINDFREVETGFPLWNTVSGIFKGIVPKVTVVLVVKHVERGYTSTSGSEQKKYKYS